MGRKTYKKFIDIEERNIKFYKKDKGFLKKKQKRWQRQEELLNLE